MKKIETMLLFVLFSRGLCGAYGNPPAVYLPLDGNLDDDRGMFNFSAKAYGDEIKYVSGVKGNALFVGGTKDWVDVAVDERLDITRGGTLKFWFKREDWTNPYTGGSGWETLVHIDGMTVEITAPGCPGHQPWALQARVESFHPEAKDPASLFEKSTLSSPGETIKPDIWYHTALVYEPDTSLGKLYIDGRLVGQRSAPVPTEKYVNPLRLGTWFEDNQAFRGAIDEIKIYDYARTADDILQSARRP